jgi:hypothetical protein
MLKRLKGAAVGCAALAITSGALWAAGSFSTLPVIGGASYCASTVTGTGGLGGITGTGQGTTGSICAQTVPAGPSIVTGNETIPADLNNPATVSATAGGTSPTTALITLASLNALPTAYPQFGNATSPNTFTVSPLVGAVYLSATTGSLSNTQMQMPANPIDGQQLRLSAASNVGTLLISPNTGQTIGVDAKVTAITVTLTGSYGYTFVWQAATSTWHRLQ